MNIDFLDAHERHWEDAETLLENTRLANADHLYGISAECGLKCLMQAFGMPISSDGSPANKKDRIHADEIWQRYESYRSGHHHGVAYALPTSDPFGDWHAAQRYAPRSDFGDATVRAHRGGAESVRALVIRAQRGGLI